MKAAAAGLSLALALGTACGGGILSSDAESQHAKLASLQFDAPADWHRSDTSARGVATAVWTPAEHNDAKTSVTVIETELAPGTATAGGTTLDALLTAAQHTLDPTKISAISPVTTEAGLHGARVEADFVPRGQPRSYHRVHVVLVDGTHLVHVLFTSRSPDADVDAFNLILHTIRHGEA